MTRFEQVSKSIRPLCYFAASWLVYLLAIAGQQDKFLTLWTTVTRDGGWFVVLKQPGGIAALSVVFIFVILGAVLVVASKVFERQIVRIWTEQTL